MILAWEVRVQDAKGMMELGRLGLEVADHELGWAGKWTEAQHGLWKLYMD